MKELEPPYKANGKELLYNCHHIGDMENEKIAFNIAQILNNHIQDVTTIHNLKCQIADLERKHWNETGAAKCPSPTSHSLHETLVPLPPSQSGADSEEIGH